MKETERNLLIRELCERMPYGVQVLTDLEKDFEGGCIGKLVGVGPYYKRDSNGIKELMFTAFYVGKLLTLFGVDEIRPYLRPLSSMTEEEYESINWDRCSHSICYSINGFHFVKIKSYTQEVLDFLLAHHFDFRGLIEKGLALEASEGMYS